MNGNIQTVYHRISKELLDRFSIGFYISRCTEIDELLDHVSLN